MTEPEIGSLAGILADRPSSLTVARIALAAWPEHAKFLLRSFRQRTPEMLDATEMVASANP